MNNDRQDEARIEAWLKRQMVTPAPDLAERILFAARHTPQRSLQSLSDWLRDLFAACHLPQPAFALAAMLTIGLGLGMLTPATNTENADNALWSATEQEVLP